MLGAHACSRTGATWPGGWAAGSEANLTCSQAAWLVENKTLHQLFQKRKQKPWTNHPRAISASNKANKQTKQRNIPADLNWLNKQTEKLRFQRAGELGYETRFWIQKEAYSYRWWLDMEEKGRSWVLDHTSHTHRGYSINICPGITCGRKNFKWMVSRI